jgi:hypothetical protein
MKNENATFYAVRVTPAAKRRIVGKDSRIWVAGHCSRFYVAKVDRGLWATAAEAEVHADKHDMVVPVVLPVALVNY